jgi:hypothetical protein
MLGYPTRVKQFLADVLALEAKTQRPSVRVHIALVDCENIYKAQETNIRMKDEAAHACRRRRQRHPHRRRRQPSPPSRLAEHSAAPRSANPMPSPYRRARTQMRFLTDDCLAEKNLRNFQSQKMIQIKNCAMNRTIILVDPEVTYHVHRDHHYCRCHYRRLGLGCDGDLDIRTNADRYSIA